MTETNCYSAKQKCRRHHYHTSITDFSLTIYDTFHQLCQDSTDSVHSTNTSDESHQSVPV